LERLGFSSQRGNPAKARAEDKSAKTAKKTTRFETRRFDMKDPEREAHGDTLCQVGQFI
jgi:hypothetical protein